MSDLRVQARPGTPLYVSVKEAVLGAIERGRYQAGEQLPSTQALSAMMGVSLVTVHRAMQELVTTGVLRRGQGRGTFVHEEYQARAGRATGVRVGLVLQPGASLADGWHGPVLEGVRRGAEEVGMDLVLLRYGEDTRGECRGYLFVNPSPDQLDRPLRFARQMRAPNDGLAVVVVGARVGRPGWAAIDADGAGTARAAVQHLHRLGHRRIGYVGGAGPAGVEAERWEGFAGQCERLGCPPAAAWTLRPASWRLDERAAAALAELLGAADRPTALVVGGDGLAAGVLEAAGRAGLRVPEDLSVICLDEPSWAGLAPGLTAFRQPLGELGRSAAVLAFEMAAKGARPASQTTLGAELVERGSTAAPGRAGR